MPILSPPAQIWYYVAAASVAVLLAGCAWPRRFVRGGAPFLAGQLVLLLLFLLQILIATVDDVPLKIRFYQAWTIVVLCGSLVALWFALDYAGLMRRVSRGGWAAISLPLLFFSGLILTNAAHRWVWSRVWYDGTLRSTLGTVGEAGMDYACILASIALAILLMRWKRAHGALRWQVALLITGATITGIAFASEIIRSDATTGRGLSVILTATGLLVVAVGFFRFRAIGPGAHRSTRPHRANEPRHDGA